MMKKAKLLFLAAVIILFFSFIFLASRVFGKLLPNPLTVFSVGTVYCETQYGQCVNEEKGKIEKIIGKNLLFLDNDFIKNVFATDAKNGHIFVQKIFPNTIKITLERKKAIAGLASDNYQGVFLIASDGTVLEFEKNTSLPILSIGDTFKSLVVGNTIDQKVIKATDILYMTYKAQSEVKGYLDQDFLRVALKEGIDVYYPLDRDTEVLVGALQLILARRKMYGELPKIIDLRYKNPVLRY